MRHTVHIMFGEAFKEASLELKRYVTKYGEEPVGGYFNALWYVENAEDVTLLSKVVPVEDDKDKFVSGVNDLFKFDLQEIFRSSKEEKQVRLKSFLLDLKNEIITINDPGDFANLHFCLYFPLYEPAIWDQVRLFVETLKSERFLTDVDLFGFASDMAGLFIAEENLDSLALKKDTYDKQVRNVLREIIAYKSENVGNVAHFIAMQNSQSCGIALALNMDSFIRIIGEFALMCTECYSEIFGVGVNNTDLQALGISMLSFDKFYFIEYLLQRTYLYAMDKERVQDKEVDINMCSEMAQKMLTRWVHLMGDFFDREVKPRLDDKMEQGKIVTEITPLLDKEFKKIGDEFESYMEDETLSIPEKRAILAALLGQDDSLFVNYMFNRKQLILDDLDREAMMVYIDANNKLLLNPDYADRACLSFDGREPIFYPLDRIREVRYHLRQSAAYIRELQEEAARLETQMTKQKDAEKCLIEGGFFIFGNQQYKLLPQDIPDEPLQENYEPHPVKSTSIDLRDGFTEVKNQGNQGSCLAFALTSVYEYFLKLQHDPNPNLSEAFLYYNTRAKMGDTEHDTGSLLQPSVQVLTELGICTEELCPYSQDIFNIPPSEAAYEDAKGRKVRKALNVERKLDAIKSAIEDGYPVAVSVKLYPSFGNQYRGIVPLPTDEEINNKENEDEKHGSHAMVVCGYSDESKVFIVRNSWGDDFGDSGYCYMPYSYLSDPELLNWACVITEIETYQILAGKGEKKVLRFDKKDAGLMYAITRNLIGEEERAMVKLQDEDNLLQEYFFKLRQILKNKNLQDDLTDASVERLEQEIAEREAQKELLLKNKQVALDLFDKDTIKKACLFFGIFIGVWAVGYLLYEYVIEELWWMICISVLVVLACCLYFPWRNSKRCELRDSWDEKITRFGVETENLKKERDTLRLRMHLAGMLLIRLFKLNDRLMNKYNVMKSFVLNLNAWYEEEQKVQETMNADTQPPFISLLRNDVLDAYFENHKEEITRDIHLWSFLKGYDLSEEGIKVFKEQLKEEFIKNISHMIEDFSVYDYISRNKVYPYLTNDYNQIMPLLVDLDRKSDIFLQCNNKQGSLNPYKEIFINTKTDSDARNWNTTYPQAFSITPTSFNISSRYKIIVFRLQDLSVDQICL